jgi:hypothetical protein
MVPIGERDRKWQRCGVQQKCNNSNSCVFVFCCQIFNYVSLSVLCNRDESPRKVGPSLPVPSLDKTQAFQISPQSSQNREVALVTVEVYYVGRKGRKKCLLAMSENQQQYYQVVLLVNQGVSSRIAGSIDIYRRKPRQPWYQSINQTLLFV